MSKLWDTLQLDCRGIFANKWKFSDGKTVPDVDDILLGNDGINLDAVVLYADLVESTALVSNYEPHFAAEVYKSYLSSACKIIKNREGTIVGFDGDRVMAIFVGRSKNTQALQAALWINGAVKRILNPALKTQYPDSNYVIRQAVGVDSGEILVAKTGVRGDNDLVWVGKAANYAAKLCTIRSEDYTSYCTAAVWKNALDEVKFHNGKDIWESRVWTKENSMPIYRSNWTWTF